MTCLGPIGALGTRGHQHLLVVAQLCEKALSGGSPRPPRPLPSTNKCLQVCVGGSPILISSVGGMQGAILSG